MHVVMDTGSNAPFVSTKNFFIAGLFLVWGVFCILGFLNVQVPNVIFVRLFE